MVHPVSVMLSNRALAFTLSTLESIVVHASCMLRTSPRNVPSATERGVLQRAHHELSGWLRVFETLHRHAQFPHDLLRGPVVVARGRDHAPQVFVGEQVVDEGLGGLRGEPLALMRRGYGPEEADLCRRRGIGGAVERRDPVEGIQVGDNPHRADDLPGCLQDHGALAVVRLFEYGNHLVPQHGPLQPASPLRDRPVCVLWFHLCVKAGLCTDHSARTLDRQALACVCLEDVCHLKIYISVQDGFISIFEYDSTRT